MSFYPSSSSPELLSPPEEPPAPPRKQRAKKPKPPAAEATVAGQDSLVAASAVAAPEKPAAVRKRRPKKPKATEPETVVPEPFGPAQDEVSLPATDFDPDHLLSLPPAADESNEPGLPAAPFDPEGVLSLPALLVDPHTEPPVPDGLPTEVLAQKRRYKQVKSSDPDLEDPDGEIIMLSSLLQNLLERKQNGHAAPEGETRKVNRFTSRATVAAVTAEFIAPVPETSLLILPHAPTDSPTPENHAAEAIAAAAFPKFEPRAYAPEPTNWGLTGTPWGRRILYFGLTAALALTAFLLGRNHTRQIVISAPRRVSEDLAPVRWMPVFANQLDRALAAERAGDLTTAASLMDELTKSMKPNPILQAYQASIDTRRGLSQQVEATLSRLLRLTPGLEASALLNEAQGFNYARRRDFDLATESFESIAETEPFNTGNLLHLGEAQRRSGRLAEAAATFRLALDRLPDSPSPATADLREYLAYEKRLSEVENGLAEQLEPTLKQHLNVPAPTHYWQLTGAAIALQKGNMASATAALKKAQVALAPEQFSALMDDYFFRSFAYHPEMKTFLSTPTPEQQKARLAKMDFYIDP